MNTKVLLHNLVRVLIFIFPCLAARAQGPSGLQLLRYCGQEYFYRTVDPHREYLRLFWKDEKGICFNDYSSLNKYLTSKNEQLIFAANAGMFKLNSDPVGLLIQDGRQSMPLNLASGSGNFYLKPNGVFLLDKAGNAFVMETTVSEPRLATATEATQSGPLLVINGRLHPAFQRGSLNVNIRSGIGVQKDGIVVFAISKEKVNFYDFAELFLSKLKCPNALYLDGTISRFYDAAYPAMPVSDFGPIFGLIKKH